jgi:hypothetical protein
MGDQDSLRTLQKSEDFIRALSGTPRIVWNALFFHRSIVGKYQNDPIMRTMLWPATNRKFSDLTRIEVVELVRRITSPRSRPKHIGSGYCLADDYFEAYKNSEPSEFYTLIAERLKHLETYHPTPGDFVIEELQNACIGFWRMHFGSMVWVPQTDWPPTKGVVIALAQDRLRKKNRKVDFSKTSWSRFLKEADLDKELIAGKAGRRQSLAENMKIERELKAMMTKALNTIVKTHGGDRRRALEVLKAAFGSSAEVRRSEKERLKNLPQNPEGERYE